MRADFWKNVSKNFFDTQSWQVVRLPHIDSVGKIKFESEISMKTFFLKKILCSLNECAHVLHHPETVENFQKCISISDKHIKRVSMRWEFFKDLWKMLNWSQKFRWKFFFFIKIFLILYCNVNTFRIIREKKRLFVSFWTIGKKIMGSLQ